MILKPLALFEDIAALQEASLLRHDSAGGLVLVPVLSGIVDIGLCAVVEEKLAGALDLQEEHIHGIGPGHFQPPSGQDSLPVDLPAGIIFPAVRSFVGGHIRRNAVKGLGQAFLGPALVARPEAGLIIR